ncbi:Unknown protein [Striga hermonthica]|uniref:NAC domain-containing protein n=1 Tax=Striga hermonthica TaxID=68872 RepID=A0A9N7NH84_STRHE|nr:Unknown protein [Striga hermonthica]
MRRSWTRADIPSGHHFLPSDEELIKFYLLPWSKGLPLPIKDLIVERDVYGETADPRVVFGNPDDPGWYVAGDEDFKKGKRVMYVLTKLFKIKTRCSRRAGGGTWSGQTTPREIYDDENGNRVIGHMRMFSFEVDGRQAKKEGAKAGHWIMHEYSLALDSLTDDEVKHKDHVLCKISWTRHDPRDEHRVVLEDNVHKKQKKAIGEPRDEHRVVLEENVHKKQKKEIVERRDEHRVVLEENVHKKQKKAIVEPRDEHRVVLGENVHEIQKKAIGEPRDEHRVVLGENVHEIQKKAIGIDYLDANSSLQPMLPDFPVSSPSCAFDYGDYELTQEDLTILNNFIWST